MNYEHVVYAEFARRINRFVALVSVDGHKEQVHIKNTGRLKEWLQPGVQVALEKGNGTHRKTNYSLIAVFKNNRWVNIDSQAPNKVVSEALKAGCLSEIGMPETVKQEVTFGRSRFDFYYEKNTVKGWIEVKGVTLEKNGVAMFPDAPTSRGGKHVLELIQAHREGYQAMILFVIQMEHCHKFIPHQGMDQDFTEALVQAAQEGVSILAYASVVTRDSLRLHQPVPVTLPIIDR